MKKFICLAILLLSTPLIEASDNAGAFIEKGLQPRAAAMGMSYVAHAKNSDATYWNPSGLSQVKKNDLTFMGTHAYETDYASIQYAMPFQDMGIGFTAILATMQDIQETAHSIRDRYDFTGQTLSYQAAAYYLGIGKEILPRFHLGLTSKLITEKAATYNASGVGCDIGLRYEISDTINWGLNIQNLVKPAMKWNTPSQNIDTIPTNIKTGFSVNLNDKLWSTLDLNIRNNRPLTWQFGIEYWVSSFLPIRGGYINDGKLSLGLGLYLDYLYLDFSWTNPELTQMEDIYRFSLGFKI